MAEAILFNVAGDMITKLGSQALREIGLQLGVKDEVEKLKETVSTIRDVLLDAEEQYEKSQQVRGWLERLKEAVYDADDLLDDISTKALQLKVMSGNKMAKQVRIFFSSSNQLAFGLKMSHKIKKIRERLDAIKADREFHLEKRTEHRVESMGWRETHSFVRAKNVIGRDDDKRAILEFLCNSNNDDENVSTIAVVGIGGLGKTTLAQLVYNDEEVKKHFEAKMWVCVSDPFDVKLIVEKIINSGTNNEPRNLVMEQLQNPLRQKIDGKKYLLVLDDVWNEDNNKWLSLKTLLLGGARGSRILVTTRAEKVARIAGAISPYVLKGLSEKESWSLFMQMAFEQGQEPSNPVIVKIGKEIVKKCVGVPLAIRTIGSLLSLKKTETEWQSFENNEFSKIPQNETDIMPTLRLSYDHLLSHLKHCFAYCRLFPKDHWIDVQMMINLWVAQGFIKLSHPSQCLEDVGYECFKELLWRSFFQEAKEDVYGRIVKCEMHDLMHDLAIQMAGIESATLNSITENIDEKTRHISFNFNLEPSLQFLTDLPKTNKVRTFLLPSRHTWLQYDKDEQFNNSIWDAVVSSFRSLRVLDLHNSEIQTVPSSIEKLKRLRYLDLSENTDIKMLPSSITKLQNLETLKLSWCIQLKKLPKDIQKMVSLKHLEIDDCEKLTHMPRGLGQLTSLQTLPLFVVAKYNSTSDLCGGLNELNRLNNLRGELNIKNLNCVNATSDFKAANMEEKRHLQTLRLEWNGESNDGAYIVDDEMSLEYLQPHPNLKKLQVRGYRGVRFPGWLSSVLTNLVDIYIIKCVRCQYLPPLDQLPSLKNLHLYLLDALEYVSDSGCDGFSPASASSSTSTPIFFPSLQELNIYQCPNLKGWWRQGGKTTSIGDGQHLLLPSFPTLSSLEIHHCPQLTSMPLFPYLETMLRLKNTSAKLLEQTLMMTTTTTAMATTVSPLSKLKSLQIHQIEDLDSLLEMWLPNLSSLEDLAIMGCPRLAWSMPRGMKHLSYLKRLKIENCKELCLSDDDDDGGIQWCALRSLVRLKMCDVPKLESLPEGLRHVTTLEDLEIQKCHNFMALPEWIGSLTALQSLKILECPNLVSLPEGVRGLTSLQSLEISKCPNLASLPEGVCGLTSLQSLDISECPNLASLLERVSGLTSLQSLEISKCPNLVSLPEGVRGLTSLQSLEISECPNLASLPEGVSGLTSLQSLEISECPNLVSLPEGVRGLTSLQSLKISKCPNLVSLPEEVRGLTSLESLKISECPNLASLPEGVCGLTSLQRLDISECPNLASLPERVSGLTSLQTLRINNSPILMQDARVRIRRKMFKSQLLKLMDNVLKPVIDEQWIERIN